jgi:hypothetical protein
MWHTVIVTSSEFENFFALRCPQYEIKVDDNLRPFKSKDQIKRVFGNQPDMSESYFRRCNRGQAEIHAMALAEAMWDTYNISNPKLLQPGEWHIPFGEDLNDDNDFTIYVQEHRHSEGVYEGKIVNQLKIKIATARQARVSYYDFLGKKDFVSDERLYYRLLGPPLHASPTEHCARAMTQKEHESCSRTILKPTSDIDGPLEFIQEGGWLGNFRGFIQLRKMLPNENITK